MKQLLTTLFIFLSVTTGKAQKPDPWITYMMPDEIHKMLEDYSGSFDLEISMWMGEGEKPAVIQISAMNKMILGGRFLEITQTGNMMGTDYYSIVTIGFNTITKLFDQTTLTNMGTGTLYLTGSWDPQNKTATLNGQITNPVDNKLIKVRQQISFIDKDNLLIESYDTYEGEKEKKTIQSKFVRKR